MSESQYQRFSERLFQVSPLLTRPGWYIRLREGKVIGPFISRETAQLALLNLFGIADSDNETITQTAEQHSHYARDSRK